MSFRIPVLTAMMFFVGSSGDSLRVALVNSTVMLGILAVVLLWYRRLGRVWRQLRARNWPEVPGKFDEGDIVTMYKGMTRSIAGYQVWMGCQYEADGEELVLYTLPFTGEFATTEEAEKCRRMVANRDIVVRVSSRNPKRAAVLDEDVRPLIGIRG